MKKNNVETIVRELASENFNLYPESYPIENGIATDEASENAQDLGSRYFEVRTENEIERDQELGITEIDYVEWVMEEFGAWVQETILPEGIQSWDGEELIFTDGSQIDSFQIKSICSGQGGNRATDDQIREYLRFARWTESKIEAFLQMTAPWINRGNHSSRYD